MRPQWECERGNFALRSSFITDDLTPLEQGGAKRNKGAPPTHSVGFYCGEPTQTATKGVFEALDTGPQEAPLSLRNCA
jgi:hypothetical protein